MASTIGVIGLGIMGSRMAANLVKAGHRVVGYNRSNRPELAELGCELADTPAAVGEQAEVVITMVTDIAALRDLALGEGGFYTPLARHGSPLHLSMETIGGDHTRALAEDAAALGIGLVGAPVSGGSGGAAAGTLAIMASGQRALFDRATPIFQILGSPEKLSYCGEEVGQGPDIKLDNNLNLLDGMVTVHLSCIGAMSAGIDPQVAYRVFLDSTGDSVGMRGRCWLPGAAANNPVDNGFAPIYKLKDALKDLRLWSDKAAKLGVPRGRVQHTIDIYEEAMAWGYAELDCSAILNVLLARAGRDKLPTILD